MFVALYLLTFLVSSSFSFILPVTYRIYSRMFPQDNSDQLPNGLYILDPSILGLQYKRAMVPLKNIDYTVQIVNSLAHITLKQEYENLSNKFLNVYFSFPVSPKSAIYKMVAQFGNKIVEGVIKQKEKARREFDEAKKTGKQAVLTEIDTNSKDIIRMNIGNIPPQSKVTITVSFVQQMTLSLSTFYRLQIPSTISPRYMNSVPLSQVKMNQFDDPLMTDYNTRISKPPGFTWSFLINLNAYRSIAFYNSTTHNLKKLSGDINEKEIKLTLEQETLPNKDFVFIYTTQDFERPSYVIGNNNKSSTVLVSFIPKFVQVKNFSQASQKKQVNSQVDFDQAKGEFVFILDRSGSMDDFSRISKAKQALIIFLRSLPTNSFFNIISFGNNFIPMFEKSQRYQNSLIKQAINDVERMDADFGGTEIYQPLDYVLGQSEIKGYPKYVFLLTDGQVQNTQSVIRMAKNKSKSAIINSIGVGNGASQALIQGTAEAGRGKHVMITDDENPSKKIINLLKSALTPLITGFSLKYDKQLIQSVIPNPQKISYILKDDTTNFYLMFKDKVRQKTIINFQYEDQQTNKIYSQEIEIDPSKQSYGFVDKMARFKVLRALEGMADKNDNSFVDFIIYNKYKNQNPYRKQAELYSIEHQILSPYTSFIAVVKQITDWQNNLYKQIGSQSVQVLQPVPKEYQNTIFDQIPQVVLVPQDAEQLMAIYPSVPYPVLDSPIVYPVQDFLVAAEPMPVAVAPPLQIIQQIPSQPLSPTFISLQAQPSIEIQPQSQPIAGAAFQMPVANEIVIESVPSLEVFDLMKNSNNDVDGSSISAKVIKLKPKPKADIDGLVTAQNIDGSWSELAIVESIFKQCDCNPNFNLQELQKLVRADILITKIVLTYLQKLNPGDEYSLIIKKSQSWLKKAIAASNTDENLLNQIKFD